MERRVAVLFFVACVACCSISTAGTVTNLQPFQSVLLDGYVGTDNAILIGDKLFGDFFYVASNSSGSATNLPAGAVSVSALSNSVGFGLSFGAPFHTTNNLLKDFIIRYSVAVTNNPGFLISDIHLSYNGTVINNGYNSVTEQAFTGGFGVGSIGLINVFNPPQTLETNMVFNTAQVKIYIEKDIQLGGFGPGDQSSISIINQTFSQIPEPSSMTLAAIGFAGLWLWRRKRH
jgi:hypothetical protein